MGIGDKEPGPFVVVAKFPRLSIDALLTKPGKPGVPAIYQDSTDAELCAAHWRDKVPEGKIEVRPCEAL